MSYDTDATLDGRRPWAVLEYWPDGDPNVLVDEDEDMLVDAEGDMLGDEVGGSPLYFSLVDQPVPLGFDVAITAPVLNGYPSKTSLRLDPSRGLGIMQEIRVSLKDFPHPDGNGMYFRRLKRTSPYYLGKRLVVYTGFITDGVQLSDLRSEEWVASDWTGPDASGKITITGQSKLRQTDERKAQAPLPNTGELVADIADTDVPPFDIDLTPSGIGDEEYGTSGKVTIGNEILSYSARVGDTITISDRAQDFTEAESHESGAAVQDCLIYTDQNVVDIVEDLLLNYTPGVDGTNIPTAEWDEEREWLSAQNYTTVIAKPQGVNELMTELQRQALIFVWWDGEAEEFKLKAIRPRIGGGTVYDDRTTILANSMQITDLPDKRLSRVRVLYGQRNPLKNLDDEDNYDVAYTNKDSAAESADQWGEPAIRTVYSRWMTSRAQAVQLSGRLVSQYVDIPEAYGFTIDASSRSDFPIGEIATIKHRLLEDDTGAEREQDILVTGNDEKIVGTTWKVVAEQSVFQGRYGVITPDTNPEDEPNPFPDYSAASDSLRANYGFICYDDVGGDGPGFLDGTDPYKIV